jgi:hypothetical protein
MHGGASLKGAASGTYKHGKYSKYMPTDLLPGYADFVNDDQRLSVAEELAAMRAFLAYELQSLGKVEAASIGSIKAAYAQLARAHRSGQGITQELKSLENIIFDVDRKVQAETNILKTSREIGRLANVERQILDSAGEMISRAFVLSMWADLMRGLKTYVSPLEGGSDAIRAIAEIIAKFTGSRAGAGADLKQLIDPDQ